MGKRERMKSPVDVQSALLSNFSLSRLVLQERCAPFKGLRVLLWRGWALLLRGCAFLLRGCALLSRRHALLSRADALLWWLTCALMIAHVRSYSGARALLFRRPCTLIQAPVRSYSGTARSYQRATHSHQGAHALLLRDCARLLRRPCALIKERNKAPIRSY